MTGRLLERVFSGVLVATMVACAHAPASTAAKDVQAAAIPSSAASANAVQSTAKPAPAPKVFVTGSHIPQRVDLATGLPVTTSPVKVYSRSQLDNTGREYDLRASLQELDPSIR